MDFLFGKSLSPERFEELNTKKPAGLVWFTLNASAIPNMALLVAVLNTIRQQ